MARSRTLANLRSDVRLRADMANSTFVADSEINEYINQSIAVLYGKLVGARGQDYYENSTTITTASGVTAYNLPSDFWELISLESTFGGVKRQIQPFMRREHAPWSETQAPGGYEFSLYYVPAPNRLSSDSDTFDGIAGWEEWVVLDAAMKCMEKEESDTTILLARQARIDKEIEGLAPFRDAGWPERITDVYRRRNWQFTLGEPRYRLKGGSSVSTAGNQIEILWGPLPGWNWP